MVTRKNLTPPRNRVSMFEAAPHIGVTYKTLAKLVAERAIPGVYNVGGVIRIDLDEMTRVAVDDAKGVVSANE